MGVRINIYAVDVPPLAAFLAQPVSAVLSYYAQHAAPGGTGLYVEDGTRRYRAGPGMPVSSLEHGQWRHVRAGEAHDACLRRPTHDWLRASSSFDLMFFLDGLSVCPAVNFIRRLVVRERRWWLGSLLDYAEHASDVAPVDYARFARLAQAVLRVYDCGKELPPGDPAADLAAAASDFPVVPRDDTDCWMGLWPEAEALFVADFLGGLRRLNPRFKPPPGKVGLASVSDEEEWNRWVHGRLGQLLVVEELVEFQNLMVVSFIG